MRADPEPFSFDEQTRELHVLPHRRVTRALRLGSWNDRLPLFRLDGAAWTPDAADPELPLVWNSHPAELDSPRARFARDIPTVACRIVAPFDRHQLTLLRLLCLCDGAPSFIESAPVLAWLLAGHLSKRFDAAVASALLQQRRVAILSEIVGAPMSPAAVRVVSRYKPDRWSEHSEQILLRVLRDPRLVAWCGHEREITPRLLFALVRHRSLVDGRFLRPALRGRHADAPDVQAVAAAARDALTFGSLLGRSSTERIVMACPTPARLMALRDRWSDAIGKRIDEVTRKRVLADAASWMFPEAPLRGTDAIVPISSAIELLDEGVDLHHCAAQIVIDVLAGAVFFYRVLAPERATLSIRVRGGVAEVDELRGMQNAAVGLATRAAVESWLRTERIATASANRRLVEVDDECSGASGPTCCGTRGHGLGGLAH